MLCHQNLERHLDEYTEPVEIAARPTAPLFQSASAEPPGQPDVWRMLRRRAVAAGITAKIGGADTFRATGITAYLSNGDKLAATQQMANHESPRTNLYDCHHDQQSPEELERLLIKSTPRHLRYHSAHQFLGLTIC